MTRFRGKAQMIAVHFSIQIHMQRSPNSHTPGSIFTRSYGRTVIDLHAYSLAATFFVSDPVPYLGTHSSGRGHFLHHTSPELKTRLHWSSWIITGDESLKVNSVDGQFPFTLFSSEQCSSLQNGGSKTHTFRYQCCS